MTMQYRTLGRTGLQVSLAGLGGGGPSRLGQATHADEAQSQRVVRRALELGVNLFDAAPAYLDSERLLGRALRGVPRDDYWLATKVWPGAGADLITPTALVAACEESLRRFGVETLDIYQLHGVRPKDYGAVVARLYPALAELRAAGKVRWLGVTESNRDDPAHRMLAEAIPSGLWDTVMVKYGILNQGAEREVFPLAQAHNVGVLNMSTVRAKVTRPRELALLLAKWKLRGLIAFNAVPFVRPLDFLVHGHVDSVVSAGYKFGAAPAAVSTVLIGTGNVAHLEANVAALLGPPLPAADTARLRALFGHLAEVV
jgi:aryl-alcohol dehydrogenase-like predicted oxidoreductase